MQLQPHQRGRSFREVQPKRLGIPGKSASRKKGKSPQIVVAKLPNQGDMPHSDSRELPGFLVGNRKFIARIHPLPEQVAGVTSVITSDCITRPPLLVGIVSRWPGAIEDYGTQLARRLLNLVSGRGSSGADTKRSRRRRRSSVPRGIR